MSFENLSIHEKDSHLKNDRMLPENHWFCVVENAYKKTGEEPSPMQIRAHSLVKTLGIPSGESSAFESGGGMQTNIDADEVFAKMLTNKVGVRVDKRGITSSDFRDIYPEGLPEELRQKFDPRMLGIIDIQYAHSKYIQEKYSNDPMTYDRPSIYFRLPGGIDLLTCGYKHRRVYQEIHGDFIEKISKLASVIAIEGSSNVPYGESLSMLFQHWKKSGRQGSYSVLMGRAIDAGFRGLFAEVDARNVKRIDYDKILLSSNVRTRYIMGAYFKYLLKENPALMERVGDEQSFDLLLRRFIHDDVFRECGLELLFNSRNDAKQFHSQSYPNDDGGYEAVPTGLEFGQMMYSDALSAIKLHLIAKLMADKKIKQGPIVDFQGAHHLSGKSFFIRYPEYAMEVVLRTLPELMAFRTRFGVLGAKWELDNPDWPEVVRQIAKLAFARTTDNPDRIDPFFYDFLGEYGIDPEKVIPSDEEVQEIMEKTKRGASIRKQGKERE